MNFSIILLGGDSIRTSTSIHKQFYEIGNKEVFLYSFETFYKNKNIDEIILVANKKYFSHVENLITNYTEKKIHIVEAGKTRQNSCFNALNYIKENYKNTQSFNVLIHDASRPLVSGSIINSCSEALKKYDAITTYLPLHDSVFSSKDKTKIDKYLDRDKTFLLQTPQCFKFDVIFSAHNEAKLRKFRNITDDTKLVKKMGYNIYLVEGDQLNFKITTFEDLQRFKEIIEK